MDKDDRQLTTGMLRQLLREAYRDKRHMEEELREERDRRQLAERSLKDAWSFAQTAWHLDRKQD